VGKAIQVAAGQRLDHFSRDHLFGPLGVADAWWWVLRDDLVYASGDIALRPRDLARLGLLYLNGGLWDGHALLPREWVEASTRAHVPLYGSSFSAAGVVGYGYGWWVQGPEYGGGAYAASGWGGQKLIVLPGLDMVVVFTGGSYWEPPLLTPHEMMTGYLLPSLVG
jgi:CubicO group peptidase (beta-lactamase class C family)